MYQLIGIDTTVRIVAALVFLFVVVPRLAWKPAVSRSAMERFWWNFGIGLTLLTLANQLLTLLHLSSTATLLALCAAVVVTGRAKQSGRSVPALVRGWADQAFLAVLNVAEGRVSVRRRMRRFLRVQRRRIATAFEAPAARFRFAGWSVLVAVAAGFRLYRPLSSANLGFSDTYVHLYLVKLLQEGRQVDPAWGPYPRGMHFLLRAIEQLTNADDITLMNFFGAVVGVLMVLGVADASRRLSGRTAIGIVAGLLFALYIGGPRQYFVLGGAFTTADPGVVQQFLDAPYADVAATGGEFDVALTAFQRQTSTLSQELAIVFLLPAVMFLLSFFRAREWWPLAGFAGCTAAIAASHSGVLVPLVLLSAVATLAVLLEKQFTLAGFRRAVAAGAVGVVVGSLWALAFFAYPYAGRKAATNEPDRVGATVLYYFPVLRSVLKYEYEPAAELVNERTFVAVTPFLATAIVLALVLAFASLLLESPWRGNVFWAAAAALLLLLVHFASMLRLPEIVQTHRNVTWLAMLLSIATAMFFHALARLSEKRIPALRIASNAALAVLVLLWCVRVPRLDAGIIHERLTSYSGYGATAMAVLQIERNHEPYSWTLVSYGQEFPMVLGRGFHLPASDFLARYDPAAPALAIPTPHVFVVVERIPHRFEVNDWVNRFSRSDVSERLQTWCTLYQLTHTDMRLTYDDGQVRVYAIERTQEAIDRVVKEGRGE